MIIILGVVQVAANCWRYVSAPLQPTPFAQVCVCPRISSFGPRCTALHCVALRCTNVNKREKQQTVKNEYNEGDVK